MERMTGILRLVRGFIRSTRDSGLRCALLLAWSYLKPSFKWRTAYLSFILGARSASQLRQRSEIARRFRLIHRDMQCAHSEHELLFIANELLRIPADIEGDIIECGVYKGGSTCKLSVVAKLVGRRVLACDSFQGLPKPSDFDAVHVHCSGVEEFYNKGDYLGSLHEVRANLSRFGEPSAVDLIPGWFHESLPLLHHRKFVCIFLDVDLYESILCCLENLWPGLQPDCKLFVHEAHHELTVRAFADEVFWATKFGHPPLPFIGARTGLGPTMPCMGYVVKLP